MAKTAVRSIDLEAIDRLEQKMKQLIGAVTRLRAEQSRLTDENGKLAREHARLAEENGRLADELATSRTRLIDAEGAQGELLALKDERDVIRGRIAEMLRQLDGITV